MPVVVVMFVVLLGLLGVLRVFFREGYEWARVSLAAVGLLIGLAAGLIAFRESPPLVFVVAVRRHASWSTSRFLALLAHPDTTEFVRGAWLAPPRGRRRRAGLTTSVEDASLLDRRLLGRS